MTNEWIIDVLADLRQYALRHHYMALAEQLDDAIVVAAGELVIEAARQIRGTSPNPVPGATLSLVAGGPATSPVSSLLLGAAP